MAPHPGITVRIDPGRGLRSSFRGILTGCWARTSCSELSPVRQELQRIGTSAKNLPSYHREAVPRKGCTRIHPYRAGGASFFSLPTKRIFGDDSRQKLSASTMISQSVEEASVIGGPLHIELRWGRWASSVVPEIPPQETHETVELHFAGVSWN
jgi:hypothetical protein